VNCLLALAWPNHQFHAPVVARLERRPLTRWATCALTQLGFVRLSSDPTIVGLRQTPAEVLALLGELARDARHMYLEALPPLPRVASHFRRLLGHQQVTDAYLVAIAESHEATLLTLDRRIVLPGASRHPVEVVVP
jgi:toxin-antitoxin system PIN domain toxin